MKVGSLFAGIGGFDLGFERAGFQVSWCVEWDRAAQAVLAARFPNARILGDVTQVDPEDLDKVDVICGGFPCQDVSVAGRRAGLSGQRSGLFHDAMRIVRRLQPRLVVLENVPGLLSSNRGLDFATVIREMGEGWDCSEVCWRILDSRYFGVAQRRRRVFIAASAARGCAEQVLALSEGVRWHPPAKREAREGSASDVARCPDGGCWWDGSDISASMTTRCHNQFMPDKGNFAAVVQAFRKSKRAQSATDDETWVDDGLANTLNGFDTGDARTTHAVAFTIDMQACKGNANVGDGSVSQTLCKPSGNDCHAVAIGVDVYNQTVTGDYATTVTTVTGGATQSGPKVITDMAIRRLTPLECERLQGFPDGWTDVSRNGRPASDTQRYKQLGNAVTVNVAEWIAKRAVNMNAIYRKENTDDR